MKKKNCHSSLPDCQHSAAEPGWFVSLCKQVGAKSRPTGGAELLSHGWIPSMPLGGQCSLLSRGWSPCWLLVPLSHYRHPHPTHTHTHPGDLRPLKKPLKNRWFERFIFIFLKAKKLITPKEPWNPFQQNLKVSLLFYWWGDLDIFVVASNWAASRHCCSGKKKCKSPGGGGVWICILKFFFVPAWVKLWPRGHMQPIEFFNSAFWTWRNCVISQ